MKLWDKITNKELINNLSKNNEVLTETLNNIKKQSSHERTELMGIINDFRSTNIENQALSTPPEAWTDEVKGYLNKHKERTETLLKHWNDMRAQTQYLPTSPEIVTYPQNTHAMRGMAFRIPTLRTVVKSISSEIYRRPPTLKQRWESKCPNCNTTYEDFKELCDNPDCVLQGYQNVKPDPNQKNIWQNFFTPRQFIKLAKQYTMDYDISDNPWLTASYEYAQDLLTGEISARKLKEVVFAKPENMRLVQDNYGRPGGLYWTCVQHRDVRADANEMMNPCPHCGLPLHNVTAVSVKLNQPATESIKESIDKMYIDGEWFHDTYHTDTTGYGVSLIYTIWILASSIWYQDELLNNTFKHGRPPKSLMIFNSYNPESILAQVTSEFNRAEQKRSYTPKIAFPFEGKNPAQVLSLMPSDAEINTIEHKKEIINRIGILWGVSPQLMADTSTGGGLNNEGMALTVLLRTVETRQSHLEMGMFRWLLDIMGVTDYKLVFPPPKEADRMAVVQRRQSNLKMIEEVLRMNADYIITNDEDWEFQIVGKMQQPQELGPGQKEMGGLQGWSPRDWQSKDQSFAFSKSLDPRVDEMVSQLLEDLAEIIILPESQPYLDNALSGFKTQFRDYLTSQFSSKIREGIDDITNLPYDIDMDVIMEIVDSRYLDQAISHLRDRLGDKLSLIENVSDGKKMIEEIIGLGKIVTSYIDTIDRTESNEFVNMGRDAGYVLEDPTDQIYDWYWTGPDYSEGRSTKVCDAIKSKTDEIREKQGYCSRSDLKSVIDEEGCKEHGDEKAFCLGREWTPHYNCRHYAVARMGRVGKSLKWVRDPSEAPEGVPIIEGPRGGYYYESSGGSGGPDEDGSPDDDEMVGGGKDDGIEEEEFGGGEQNYQAIGVRDGDGQWSIKFYSEEQKEEIEGHLQQQGFELKGETWVKLTEAVG